MPKPLSPWAQEAHDHWKKYRPTMYRELQESSQLEERLRRAVERAKDCYASVVEAGRSALEAQSEAKRNYLFLPCEETSQVDPTRLPDPSLITTPGPMYIRAAASRRSKPG